MTEGEWLECEEPGRMLACIEGGASERKLRLFACACCRLVWDRLADERSWRAAEVAERFADGEADAAELDAAEATVDSYCEPFSGNPAWTVFFATDRSALHAAQSLVSDDYDLKEHRDPVRQAALPRDLFGGPSRPVAIALDWLAPVVTQLAETAYHERLLPGGQLDLARLAVLSDALEEAGCTDAAILSHLRSPGPHVRGCWPLDLVLGKE